MQRFMFMLTLILAGELIFGLPFHTARFFRPTYLEVFGFSNTQLGDVFAIYGITAMLAYFPGGVLADRYSPRLLMTLSLFATAGGGVYMATFPAESQMALLYGYWGVSTVFLFWAAMISATREWGGDRSQGKAFGILDGGRGLVAAGFAVFAVSVLSLYMPAEVEMASDAQRQQGFRMVIWLYSAAAAATGFLTWFVLPKSVVPAATAHSNPLTGMLTVLRRPIVWAQAAVIVCAYSGFKGLDNYSLYSVQVLGMDEVAAAKFTAYASYLRPVAAVVAGVVADRFSSSRIIAVTFFILVLSYSGLAVAAPSAAWLNFIYANMLVSFFAVFALRGIYFALLQEIKTPKHLTGSTVGLVSLVGYTPDIFFAPITGRILDSAPGLAGHQHYFIFLGGVAVTGMLVVAWLVWLNRRQSAGV
ncbi:MAG: MFS transporter [Gammaproteobacteria bacterium]|nr:MFS transporter [Gammaproteobacteria bacterium]